MAVESQSLLPSELSRLILGHLEAAGNHGTASRYLSENDSLGEVKALIARNRKVNYTVGDKTLVELLDEGAALREEIDALYRIVEEALGKGQLSADDVNNEDGLTSGGMAGTWLYQIKLRRAGRALKKTLERPEPGTPPSPTRKKLAVMPVVGSSEESAGEGPSQQNKLALPRPQQHRGKSRRMSNLKMMKNLHRSRGISREEEAATMRRIQAEVLGPERANAVSRVTFLPPAGNTTPKLQQQSSFAIPSVPAPATSPDLSQTAGPPSTSSSPSCTQDKSVDPTTLHTPVTTASSSRDVQSASLCTPASSALRTPEKSRRSRKGLSRRSPTKQVLSKPQQQQLPRENSSGNLESRDEVLLDKMGSVVQEEEGSGRINAVAEVICSQLPTDGTQAIGVNLNDDLFNSLLANLGEILTSTTDAASQESGQDPMTNALEREVQMLEDQEKKDASKEKCQAQQNLTVTMDPLQLGESPTLEPSLTVMTTPPTHTEHSTPALPKADTQPSQSPPPVTSSDKQILTVINQEDKPPHVRNICDGAGPAEEEPSPDVQDSAERVETEETAPHSSPVSGCGEMAPPPANSEPESQLNVLDDGVNSVEDPGLPNEPSNDGDFNQLEADDHVEEVIAEPQEAEPAIPIAEPSAPTDDLGTESSSTSGTTTSDSTAAPSCTVSRKRRRSPDFSHVMEEKKRAKMERLAKASAPPAPSTSKTVTRSKTKRKVVGQLRNFRIGLSNVAIEEVERLIAPPPSIATTSGDSALSILASMAKQHLEGATKATDDGSQEIQLVTGLTLNGNPVNCVFVDESGRPVSVDTNNISPEKLAELGLRTESPKKQALVPPSSEPQPVELGGDFEYTVEPAFTLGDGGQVSVQDVPVVMGDENMELQVATETGEEDQLVVSWPSAIEGITALTDAADVCQTPKKTKPPIAEPKAAPQTPRRKTPEKQRPQLNSTPLKTPKRHVLAAMTPQKPPSQIGFGTPVRLHKTPLKPASSSKAATASASAASTTTTSADQLGNSLATPGPSAAPGGLQTPSQATERAGNAEEIEYYSPLPSAPSTPAKASSTAKATPGLKYLSSEAERFSSCNEDSNSPSMFQRRKKQQMQKQLLSVRERNRTRRNLGLAIESNLKSKCSDGTGGDAPAAPLPLPPVRERDVSSDTSPERATSRRSSSQLFRQPSLLEICKTPVKKKKSLFSSPPQADEGASPSKTITVTRASPPSSRPATALELTCSPMKPFGKGVVVHSPSKSPFKTPQKVGPPTTPGKKIAPPPSLTSSPRVETTPLIGIQISPSKKRGGGEVYSLSNVTLSTPVIDGLPRTPGKGKTPPVPTAAAVPSFRAASIEAIRDKQVNVKRRVALTRVAKRSPLKTENMSNWEAQHDISNLDNYSARSKDYVPSSQSEMSQSETDYGPPAVPEFALAPARERHSTAKGEKAAVREPGLSPIKKTPQSASGTSKAFRRHGSLPLPLSEENVRLQRRQRQRHHSSGTGTGKPTAAASKKGESGLSAAAVGAKRKRSASGSDAESPTAALDVNLELTPQVIRGCDIKLKRLSAKDVERGVGDDYSRSKKKSNLDTVESGGSVMEALGLMRKTPDGSRTGGEKAANKEEHSLETRAKELSRKTLAAGKRGASSRQPKTFSLSLENVAASTLMMRKGKKKKRRSALDIHLFGEDSSSSSSPTKSKSKKV